MIVALLLDCSVHAAHVTMNTRGQHNPNLCIEVYEPKKWRHNRRSIIL